MFWQDYPNCPFCKAWNKGKTLAMTAKDTVANVAMNVYGKVAKQVARVRG